MRVDVWSDVICPWCYIGKRRFEQAVGEFEHGSEVQIVWRSFELDPHSPAVRPGDMAGHLARKYRMSPERAGDAIDSLTAQAATEGLAFRLDLAVAGNTFDAHRLLHFAEAEGPPGSQGALKERLLSAYFTEGVAIGSVDELARLGAECGLEPARLTSMLGGSDYADTVRADEAAATELGIAAVPSFLIDDAILVPGAQDAGVFLRVLRRAWERQSAGSVRD